MPSRVLILNGLTCLVSACGAREASPLNGGEFQVAEIKVLEPGLEPSLAATQPQLSVSTAHKSVQAPAIKAQPSFKRVQVDAVMVTLAPDASWVAAGTLGGVVVLEDLNRGERLWNKVLPEHARVVGLATALGQPVIAALAGEAPEFPAYVLHADTLKDAGPWGREKAVGKALALSEDGQWLATFSHLEGQGELALYHLSEHATRHVNADTKSPEAYWKKTLPALDGAVVAFVPGSNQVVLAHAEGVLAWSNEGQDQTLKSPWDGRADERPLALSVGADTLSLLSSKALYQASIDANTTPEAITWARRDLSDVEVPLRGLWFHPERKEWLVVARPPEGGVVLYDAKGQLSGRWNAGCRCEAHAVAARTDALACVCDRPSEVRVGQPIWEGQVLKP